MTYLKQDNTLLPLLLHIVLEKVIRKVLESTAKGIGYSYDDLNILGNDIKRSTKSLIKKKCRVSLKVHKEKNKDNRNFGK